MSDNVILEENVKLSPGCIIGAGVVLGPDITVPVATCLMANPPPDDFDDSASKQGKGIYLFVGNITYEQCIQIFNFFRVDIIFIWILCLLEGK